MAGAKTRASLILLACFIGVASLGIHVIYLRQIEDHIFFSTPKLDSANYHETALALVNGEETCPGVLTYNPLYPFILSVLYRFMGEPDFYTVRIIQAIVGALNCVLILIVGARYFDRRTGIVAALAALLYAPLLFFDGELIQSVWVLFFVLMAFALVPLDARKLGWGRLALALVAGTFFGVGLLGRPNMLPFLVFY